VAAGAVWLPPARGATVVALGTAVALLPVLVGVAVRVAVEAEVGEFVGAAVGAACVGALVGVRVGVAVGVLVAGAGGAVPSETAPNSAAQYQPNVAVALYLRAMPTLT
jgi:hypothetical protein